MEKSLLNLTSRPEENQRTYRSNAVEAEITSISSLIHDTVLKRMFEQCYPNTLDMTIEAVTTESGSEDAFIITGDIPALWLRDSTNQILPYRHHISSDSAIRDLFIGLIRRQTKSIGIDPYANAFTQNFTKSLLSFFQKKNSNSWKDGVWERKYELDSLCAFLTLSYEYYEACQDTSLFDADWTKVVQSILMTLQDEQETLTKDSAENMFRFLARNGKIHPALRLSGYGYPGKKCGLVRTVFRPSDDEAVFPYHIPANAMAVVALKNIAHILEVLGEKTQAERACDIANTIDAAIKEYGIVEHKKYGRIFAYEVDGYGSHCLMDDPNTPSLLSLPHTGYCSSQDPVYKATRAFILSEDNPFFARGTAAHGLTSPHTGVLSHFWPMATIVQALTSDSEDEIRECLTTLRNTHADTHFIHESVHVDDPTQFTRPWFAWANSLFGELIVKISKEKPSILAENF